MKLTDLKSHHVKLITAVTVALGVAILVSIVFFARTIFEVVQKKERKQISTLSTEPLKQEKKSVQAYEAIIRNNPFGVPAGSLQYHSLGKEQSGIADIKLVGTISGDLKHGYAVFINKDGKQSMLRTRESVFGVGELASVEKNRAFIRKEGKLVKIDIVDLIDLSSRETSKRTLNPSDLVRSSGKGEYVLDQKQIQFALDNPAQIMKDARLVPNMTNNKQDGFVLREVRENGLYNRLGMRDGDVLLRINGSNISNPENAFQAFMALKGLDKVQLDMIRDGNRMTMSYLIR